MRPARPGHRTSPPLHHDHPLAPVAIGDELTIFDANLEPIGRATVEAIERDTGLIQTDDGGRWAPGYGARLRDGGSRPHPSHQTVRHGYRWSRVGAHRKYRATIGRFSLEVRQIRTGDWVTEGAGHAFGPPHPDLEVAQRAAELDFEAAIAEAMRLLGSWLRT